MFDTAEVWLNSPRFNKKDKRKLFFTAPSFILSVFVAYFIIGLGVTFLIDFLYPYKQTIIYTNNGSENTNITTIVDFSG